MDEIGKIGRNMSSRRMLSFCAVWVSPAAAVPSVLDISEGAGATPCQATPTPIKSESVGWGPVTSGFYKSYVTMT